MASAVEIDGGAEARRQLVRFGTEIADQATREGDRDAARAVVQRTRQGAPTASGALKSTVRAIDGTIGAMVAAGAADVLYAAVVHGGRQRGNVGAPPGNRLGVSVVAARPFLREGALRSAALIVNAYEATYGRAVNRV